jgi:hypothetical protein
MDSRESNASSSFGEGSTGFPSVAKASGVRKKQADQEARRRQVSVKTGVDEEEAVKWLEIFAKVVY